MCQQCGNWCYEFRMGHCCEKCQHPWPDKGAEEKGKEVAKPLLPEERERLQRIIEDSRAIGLPSWAAEAKLQAADEAAKPVAPIAPSKAFNIAKREEEQATKALEKAQGAEKRAEEYLEQAKKESRLAKEKRDAAAAKRKQAFNDLSADEKEKQAEEVKEAEAKRRRTTKGPEGDKKEPSAEGDAQVPMHTG